MPCPMGAGRRRAPLAVGANGGCAARHGRDDANILLPQPAVELVPTREDAAHTSLCSRVLNR
jgi:hypothetical protein